MLVVNISTLSFIYFITFFCSKDDDGAKILFIFVFGFGIGFLLDFLNKKCGKLILPYNFVRETEKQEEIIQEME